MKIILQRSKGVLVYLLLCHFTALAMVCLLQLHWLLMLMLLLSITASLLFYAHCYGWLGRLPAVTALKMHAANHWFVVDSKGREQGPYHLQSSVIGGPLIVLYLQPASNRWTRSVLLIRDAVDSESWRRLRIRLRDPESWV